MKRTLQQIVFIVLIFLLLPGFLCAGGMYFIENRGQWQPDILFRAEIPSGFLFLKEKSLAYVFYDASKVAAQHAKAPSATASAKQSPDENTIAAHGVEVRFQNASSDIIYTPKKPISTRFSYFLGNKEQAWASDVQGFEEVLYQNIYAGIDLRIYLNSSTLKYEFIVQPGANVAQIAMLYEGASKVALNAAGQTVVTTSVGNFKEGKPYSFQTLNKKTVEVASAFVLGKDNSLHFTLPDEYDKTKVLVIDPELVFSSYSGSISDNWGHTATYDTEGNLYSGGTVFGSNFPATTGAFQVKFDAVVDVSIMKFTPDGTGLVYATFLGGNSTDIPNSLIVNSKNELVILGTTSSKNFPVKTTAFQSLFGGGISAEPISGLELPNGSDIFISKLSTDGKQLPASTFLGGSGNDGLSTVLNSGIKNYGDSFRGEVIVDKEDNILIVSSTNSANFPLRNPAQGKLSGEQDGVVAKLATGLNTLLWSSYIGGASWDAAYSLKNAVNGDVYVTGITQSSDLATHTTAYQPKLNGAEDAFIARYTNNQSAGMTYLGTDKEDGAYLIDVDNAGSIYVYGLTKGDYPVSSGVYQNAKSGQFIHALDAGLSKTLFSTVIGSGRGTPDISPTAFLVSECGNIYLAGWGGSVNSSTQHNLASSTNNLKVTDDAIQPTTNGNNFYIAILEQGAKSLLYATYFGSTERTGNAQGDHVDGGTSRFDKSGKIYHATCACGGSHFPVTPQAWSETNNSPNCNNAAFKIDIDRLEANFDVYSGTTKDVTRGCAPLALTFLNTSEGGVDYIWEVGGSTISREEEQSEYTFTKPGEYVVTLKAYNRLTCKRVDVAQKTILVESLTASTSADTTVCENASIKLFAAGGTQYKWSPTAGIDNPVSATPVVNVKESTEYTVEISNTSGCKVTETVKVAVEKKTDFMDMPDTEVCIGSTVVLTISGDATEYRWKPGNGLEATTGKSVTVKPDQTTTYTVEGFYADGCRPVREITVKVDRSFQPDFEIATGGGACNEPFSYSLTNKTSNAKQYEWDLGTGNVIKETDVSSYTYETPGKYTVTLTAYNAAGCALTVSKEVTAAEPFVLTNVITPNGDGKNDFFVVPVQQSSLEVYNRWGKQIYKAMDYKNDWGKGIANGTYLYVVDTPQGNHCKGWVEVLE